MTEKIEGYSDPNPEKVLGNEGLNKLQQGIQDMREQGVLDWLVSAGGAVGGSLGAEKVAKSFTEKLLVEGIEAMRAYSQVVEVPDRAVRPQEAQELAEEMQRAAAAFEDNFGLNQLVQEGGRGPFLQAFQWGLVGLGLIGEKMGGDSEMKRLGKMVLEKIEGFDDTGCVTKVLEAGLNSLDVARLAVLSGVRFMAPIAIKLMVESPAARAADSWEWVVAVAGIGSLAVPMWRMAEKTGGLDWLEGQVSMVLEKLER